MLWFNLASKLLFKSINIRYFIPESVQQASLQISDLTGKVIRQVNIKERGAGNY